MFGSRTMTLEAGTIEADLVTLGDDDVGWDQQKSKTPLESISIGGHSLRHPTASKFLGGEPGSLKKGSDHGLWRVMPCERSFREFAPTPSPRLH